MCHDRTLIDAYNEGLKLAGLVAPSDVFFRRRAEDGSSLGDFIPVPLEVGSKLLNISIAWSWKADLSVSFNKGWLWRVLGGVRFSSQDEIRDLYPWQSFCRLM